MSALWFSPVFLFPFFFLILSRPLHVWTSSYTVSSPMSRNDHHSARPFPSKPNPGLNTQCRVNQSNRVPNRARDCREMVIFKIKWINYRFLKSFRRIEPKIIFRVFHRKMRFVRFCLKNDIKRIFSFSKTDFFLAN